MLRECLMKDHQSLGTDWCEEGFDSEELLGTAVVTTSWYLRIRQREAQIWRP